MKKLVCLALVLALLLTAVPSVLVETASAAGAVVDLYIRQLAELRFGEPDEFSEHKEAGSMVGVVISIDEDGGGHIDMEGRYFTAFWSFDECNADEMLTLFNDLVTNWESLADEDYDLVLYYGNGAIGVDVFIKNAETAEVWCAAAQLLTTVANRENAGNVIDVNTDGDDADFYTDTTQSVRPIVPSIQSFVDYRLPVTNGVDDYGQSYVRVKGFNSTDAMKQLANDYIALLTEQYGYELVETGSSGVEVGYGLEYTGVGNIRPVALSYISGHIIVTVSTSLSNIRITYSPSLDYLETDDRTTVNLR